MASSAPVDVFRVVYAESQKHGAGDVVGSIIATALVLRESGGDPTARCYNYDRDGKPACSSTPLPAGTPGTDRGVDRGWFQFNSKAFPNITDAIADTPALAAAEAWRVTDGFRKFGPWSGASLTGEHIVPAAQAAKAVTGVSPSLDDVVDRATGGGGLNVLDETVDAITGIPAAVVDAVVPWADGLSKLLSVLISLDFWRRVGVFVLGAALVVFAATRVF